MLLEFYEHWCVAKVGLRPICCSGVIEVNVLLRCDEGEFSANV